MKLYADENFPLRTIKEMQQLGHDILTALDDKRANQAISDKDILARATELGRAVLTINRKDFKRLTSKKFKSRRNYNLHRRCRPYRTSNQNFRKGY